MFVGVLQRPVLVGSPVPASRPIGCVSAVVEEPEKGLLPLSDGYEGTD
jgi:hypothetical protein